MAYKPIEDYGIIGNLQTTALVATDGAIDFFCHPDFDSPSVFAALLDDQRGGSFRIAPTWQDGRTHQLYVPDTNVLITRFMSAQGILEVTDFMPVSESASAPALIVRLVRAVWGDIPVHMMCRPAFDYGRSPAHFCADLRTQGAPATDLGRAWHIRCDDAHDMRLFSSEALTTGDDCLEASFTLCTGQKAFFVLSLDGDSQPPHDVFTQRHLDAMAAETIAFWQRWVSRITYRGRWQNMIHRSALVLKLLTSRRHGSMIAAPTFGLPEAIGGRLNWDYRYCWIRDAAFTVSAFLRLGLKDEAVAFNNWIDHIYDHPANDADGKLQLMYRIDGSASLDESTLDHFAGYRDSRPVRTGNAASRQFQLDLYGELMDCIYLANAHITRISHDA